MKNQYVGDIGDYGKYSLLRAFTDAGVRVGINWYLTENDGSNDGKFTDYLNRDDIRRYNPEVFDKLKFIAFRNNKSVSDIQESGLLDGAVYYSEIISSKGKPAEREDKRKHWFENSINIMRGAELVFMDPDNGLLEDYSASKQGTEKYVLPGEVEAYYTAGHNVVYYCHKGRRKPSDWITYKSRMFKIIPDAKPVILTYHKGSQRSYVFLVHDKDFTKYRKILDQFTSQWSSLFTEEDTDYGDVSEKSSGESITIEKANRETVTIEKRADGQLSVRTSGNPTYIRVLSPEDLCRCLGI